MGEDLNPFKGMSALDLIIKLEKLKETDIDAFFELIFASLSKFPDEAVSDGADQKSKIKAINRIINHFESIEEFEKCHILKKILDRIEDEE